MDSVIHQGVTVTDPVELALLLTGHFREWFERRGYHYSDGIEGEDADGGVAGGF